MKTMKLILTITLLLISVSSIFSQDAATRSHAQQAERKRQEELRQSTNKMTETNMRSQAKKNADTLAFNLYIRTLLAEYMRDGSLNNIRNNPELQEKILLDYFNKIDTRYTAFLHGEAFSILRDTLDNLPDSNTQPLEKSAQIKFHYDMGILHTKYYNFDRAIKEFTTAIRLNPDYVEAYYRRGYMYSSNHMEFWDKAIIDFTEVIRLKPDYEDAYYLRGSVYFRKKDYDQAIKDSTEAIRLKPDYDEAYNLRGNAYFRKKDYDHAIKDLTEAIRLKPDIAQYYYNRGYMYHHKKDYKNAITDYETALQKGRFRGTTEAQKYLQLARKRKKLPKVS